MPDLTLVSFNTHAGLQARRNGGCEPYDLAGVLRTLDADVIVLQESFRPSGGVTPASEIARELGAEVYELAFGNAKLDPWPHIPRDGKGTGIVGLAVITRIPTVWRGVLSVGRMVGDPTPERAGLHLELDVGGTAVDLVGVHLTSRLPYGPPIQISRLRPQLPAPGRPAIVAGDYNFWGPGVRAFLPGWRRAVRGRTWPSSRPHSQIDHILVRPEIEVVSSSVLPALGSDHRAVRATMRVR
jgi:endonuclease/exonuclease/phosphatase family metal-dependent hydrolase